MDMTSGDVCVLGGRGFVGSAVTAELRDNGHDVTTMDPHVGGDRHISLSILSTDLDEYLDGFGTVINLVGLSPMQEPGVPGYHDLHVAGVENVVGACATAGVSQLIHMSALGADPTAEMTFLQTKGFGEKAVLDADIDTTVVRPSMIFDHDNELIRYARRFMPLRVFPTIPAMIQPVYRQDVAELFRKAVEGDVTEAVLEVGGPDTLSLYRFVAQFYNANGYACYPAPVLPVMNLGLRAMEYLPLVPFGADQARYLTVDNTADRNDAAEYCDLTAYREWLDDEFSA